MNVLCPACRQPIAVAVGDLSLRCAACGLDAPMSRVGTAPGVEVGLAVDRSGQALGIYQLEARIGSGGMGTVYRARDASGRVVAVKVMHPELQRGDHHARFRREAEALRRLDHPGLARLLDVGDHEGTAFLVTELIEGHDLAARVKEGPLPVADAARLVAEACQAIATAHAQGIVHRDLKPANLVCGDDGRVRVVDFGLATLLGDPQVTALTRTDLALGTLNYLAPEQRRDARSVDGRTDVYALGVIFYELVTGELPLGRFPLPSARGLDRRCDSIVERALDPDPARRFQDVAALAAALDPLARPAPRRAWILGTAALAAIGLGTFGVMLATGDDRSETAIAPSVVAPAVVAPSPLDSGLAIPVPVAVDAATPIVVDAAPAPAPDARRRPRLAPGGKPSKMKPPVKRVPQ